MTLEQKSDGEYVALPYYDAAARILFQAGGLDTQQNCCQLAELIEEYVSAAKANGEVDTKKWDRI